MYDKANSPSTEVWLSTLIGSKIMTYFFKNAAENCWGVTPALISVYLFPIFFFNYWFASLFELMKMTGIFIVKREEDIFSELW